MLIQYPQGDELIGAFVVPAGTTIEEVHAREGESWWRCDDADCTAEVQVVDGIPEGWDTSDPEKRPFAGAAQFCPKHVAALPDDAATPEVASPGDAQVR